MALAQEEVERRIVERIRTFDAVALRQLLDELGYAPWKIRYRANYTAAPQPTLLDAIDFHRGGDAEGPPGAPMRPIDLVRMDRRGSREEVEVTVTVNLGLLSDRSPLPSYFEELLDDPSLQAPLSALMDMLDAGLIRDRLESFRPERVPSFLPDWGATKRDWLRLASAGTPCTIHWMFQQIFPELEVSVRRVPLRRAMRAPGVRLGDPRSRVGTAAFGGEAEVTVFGLEVTLLADAAVTDTGDPWPLVALQRTEDQAFPVLGEAAVNLTVVLLSRARLPDIGLDDGTHVGSNPLHGEAPPGEAPRRAGPPWRVVIWSGVAPEEGGGAPESLTSSIGAARLPPT